MKARYSLFGLANAEGGVQKECGWTIVRQIDRVIITVPIPICNASTNRSFTLFPSYADRRASGQLLGQHNFCI